MLYTVSNLVVQAKVNLLGTDVAAAWAAISKLDGVFWLTMTAFGTAMTTFTGQNYGAGKMNRVRRGMHVGIVISIGLTAGICLPLLIFSRQLLGIFSTDEVVLALGLQYTFFLVPTYFTYTGTELLGGVIKGAGDSFAPMLITGVSAFAIRSLWAMFAPMIWPGMNTIMLSYPISWSVSTILFIIYYNFGHWMKNDGKNRRNQEEESNWQ